MWVFYANLTLPYHVSNYLGDFCKGLGGKQLVDFQPLKGKPNDHQPLSPLFCSRRCTCKITLPCYTKSTDESNPSFHLLISARVEFLLLNRGINSSHL